MQSRGRFERGGELGQGALRAGRIAAERGTGSRWLRGAAAAVLCANAVPALAQVAPPPNPGERLGTATAFGDFNGDSFTDVAVAAPGARVSGMIMIRVPPGAGPEQRAALAAEDDGVSAAGSVRVFLGSENGLAAPTLLDQSMLDQNEDGDEFGRALIAADFNGDGIDDLAVGAPGKRDQSGAVFLYQGGPLGLTPLRALFPETGDLGQGASGTRFGSALAVGQLDADPRVDLAVGAPGVPTPEGLAEAGAVFVYSGSGPDADGRPTLVTALQRIDQALEMDEKPELRDRFGSALVALDLDGDGRQELAIGSPGEGLGAEPRGSGAVFVYRNLDGKAFRPLQQFDQELLPGPGVGLSNQPNDGFGSALAAGDFDGDGVSDLAVGAPNVGQDVGLVVVLRGAVSVLVPSVVLSGLGVPDARYGGSLAAADFNGDGSADLAVGAPGRSGGSAIGTVFVLVSAGPVLRLEQRAFVADTRDATRGELGSAIAAGDVDGDGLFDLAVGAPGALRGGSPSGRLLLLRGNVTPAALGEPRELIELDILPVQKR